MNLSEIFLSFGAGGIGYISLYKAPRISEREYDFPDGAFLISLYVPYFVETETNMANFASARDYHVYFSHMFYEVGKYMKEKYPDSYFRGFADVSPFDEVKTASMCGLGVIGRHRMLITPDASSFVVIGEAVTSLSEEELASEGIKKGRGTVEYCENCGVCARACPQNAILSGEKERCISSITQKKGELNEGEHLVLRKSGYVWGCDICANSCPHTKRAIEKGTLECRIPYFTNGRIGIMDEEKLMSMSDEEYSEYSFSWRKREVMLRNIRILNEKGEEE